MADTSQQKLHVLKDGVLVKSYTISIGRGGESSQIRSSGTPLGWHTIWLKVGDKEPIGRWIFRKKVTNVIIPIETNDVVVPRDYLITRVLALEGLEDGFNRGGNVDSIKRGINIHGTPEEGRLGQKVSRGCIRMKNTDVIELYDIVPKNTLVYIMS